MFKLINSYGNVIREVATERQKDELIKKGYKLAIDKSIPKKKKAADKNE